MSVSDPAADLREELRALERAYTIGHHGPGVARRRAGLVDVCLVDLFERAGSPPGVAILAIGGYGRMVQLPASDIDLLVVHDDAASIGETVDALLYPLWDAGLAAISQVAVSSLVPRLVPAEQLPAANGLSSMIESSAMATGRSTGSSLM